MRTALFLLPLCIACGKGSTLSEDDAQTVFTAMSSVNTDVQVQVSTAASTASPAALTATTDGTTYTFTGSIENGSLWEGTILVDGSMATSDDGGGGYTYAYALAMEYQDVHTMSPDLTLNGPVDLALDYALAQSGSYTYSYALVGSLDITGEVEGSADFDYVLKVAVDTTTGAYTYSASGDIGGNDVSGFTTSGSTGL